MHRASGIPCALFSMRGGSHQTSGILRRENAKSRLQSHPSFRDAPPGGVTRNPSIRMFDGQMDSGFALSAQNWRYANFVATRALSDNRYACAGE